MRTFAKFILAIIVFSLIALLFSSCITYQKCVDKFGRLGTDSTEKAFKVKAEIITSSDSTEDGISLDSLCAIWQSQTEHFHIDSLGKVHRYYNQEITKISNSGKTELSYWIDRYNRVLRMKAKTKTDTIVKIVEGKVSCPPVMDISPDNDRTLWKQFQLFAAWLVIVGLVLTVCYFIWFKR